MIAQTPDGHRIYYAVSGTGADIMILHGAASDADTMAPLATHLARAYRTITLDRLGYRRSSPLHQDTTLAEQAQAVEAVREDSARGPVWLCGYSSGGNIAAGYAILFPAAVRGLILIEPPMYALYPDDSTPSALRVMREEIVPLFGAGEISEGIRRFTRHLEIPQETWNALAESGHGANTQENWPPLRYEFKFALDWPRSPQDLHPLTQPVLLLEGERTSPLLHGAAERFLDAVGHAERVLLPDCDHLAPIVQPQLVADQIHRFIARHPASG